MNDISDQERKCGLYTRVSTLNQAEEGESLDEQEEKLRAYCSYKGWKAVAIYREEGFSGKDLIRPAFQRMMTDMQRGKINTVIVKKIDRLSRSIIDFENVYKTFTEKNVDLISLQENFDTSTAIGRSVIRIVLIFAQLEREQTSERTIDVMAYRAKQGLFNGGYPRLGYNIDYENKCLVPNESEIPAVELIFETYLKLGSLTETAAELNAKGYRMKSWTTRDGTKRGNLKFQKSSVSRILNDPVYIGKVKHKNNLYDGKQKAIISEDLFSSVQTMLDGNNVTKTNYRQGNNIFFLKGLLYCGTCHSAMTSSFAISKGHKYFYYRCTVDNDRSKKACRIGSVQARQLENLVVEELKFLAKDPRIIEGVVKNATTEQRIKAKELTAKKKTLQDKLVQIDKRAQNLVGVLEDEGKKSSRSGYILQELDKLNIQAEQLKSEITSVEYEANDLENKIVSADIILENFKVFKDVYDNLTDDEKYDLLHLLIRKIVYYEDAEPDKDGKKRGKIKMDLWELPPINPLKLTSANGFAESSVWLPFVNEVRTFLSTPSENYLMLSMLNDISFLNA